MANDVSFSYLQAQLLDCTGSWEAPISGKNANRPPPCGGLIMTKFDPTRAVYFGGRRETGYTNETFIFDLEIKV